MLVRFGSFVKIDVLLNVLKVACFYSLLILAPISISYAHGLIEFKPNSAAKASEVNANFAALDQAINHCGTATDIMVKVGPICVDKYEASVWSNPDGTGTLYGVKAAGETNVAGGGLLRPGDDYPCNDNGNDCSVGAANPIYAVSKFNTFPSRYITWFQAQQACANSGKRLLTNAEWQMAVAGTPDTTTVTQAQLDADVANPTLEAAARANPAAAGDDSTTTCSTVTSLGASQLGVGTFIRGAFLPEKTGARTNCVSNWGVNDMIGNLWEWVADWIPGTGTASTGTTNERYFHDYMASTLPAGSQGDGANFPAAIYRGANGRDWYRSGAFAYSAARSPVDSVDDIGFRCGR